jgi:hypothetical protein
LQLPIKNKPSNSDLTVGKKRSILKESSALETFPPEEESAEKVREDQGSKFSPCYFPAISGIGKDEGNSHSPSKAAHMSS